MDNERSVITHKIKPLAKEKGDLQKFYLILSTYFIHTTPAEISNSQFRMNTADKSAPTITKSASAD
jgi:hypothetical protein